MKGTNRVTVQEAARALRITEGAVRARIHRGTLETEREGGTVYVRVDADYKTNERAEQYELVRTLREYNTSLERQLNAEREARRRADTIIVQLTQANATLAARVPGLEAPREVPPEAPEAPETGPEMPMGATPSEASEATQEGSEPRRERSW
jgi:hypothetical protein